MSAKRVREALDAIVDRKIAGQPLTAVHPGTVKAQSADGTLAVKPDSTTVPGGSGIPIRPGIPGVTIRVPAGARVAIAYEGGDERKPVATVWESGEDGTVPTEITIEGSSSVTLKSAGQEAAEHLVTLEQLVIILVALLDPVLGVTSAMSSPITWKSVPAPYPDPTSPIVVELIRFFSLNLPLMAPLPVTLAAAMQTAIAAQPVKPHATGPLGQLIPGFACKGTKSG